MGEATKEVSQTGESTFQRYYAPVMPRDLNDIGIGDTYFYQVGNGIKAMKFPNLTHSVDDLRQLSRNGHLYMEMINRGDLEARNWYPEMYNNEEVTFTKMIRFLTCFITVDFKDHVFFFYTKDSEGEMNVSFRGVIVKVPDFDRIVKLTGFE